MKLALEDALAISSGVTWKGIRLSSYGLVRPL